MGTIKTTKSGKFCVSHLGELSIIVMSSDEWSDAEWREYLELEAEFQKSEATFGAFNFAPERAPSAAQRRMVTTEFREALHLDAQRRAVVLTESAIGRGAVTAMNWIMPGEARLRAFKPTAYAEALAWLRERVTFDVERAPALFKEMLSLMGYSSETMSRVIKAS